MKRRGLLAPGFVGTMLGVFACSTLGERDSAPGIALGEVPAGTPPGATGGAATPPPSDDDDESPPPEREIESSFRAPIVTGKYVWSANPASGRVALIDASSFEVRAVDAGFGPTQVAAVERGDDVPRALVINAQGHDATLLELETDGTILTRRVALHEGADSWSVSPDGRFAIAWSDSRNVTVADPTDGFQDITVIELATSGELTATRLTVGYRPSSFAFAGERAFAVTQDGISVIELDAGDVRLSALVQLPSTVRVQPDVSISADGARALARIEGSATLYEVTLATGTISEHELGGRITDLDLSADGSTAVAVVQRVAPAGESDADAGVEPDAGEGDAGAAPEPAEAESEAVFIPLPAGLADASLRRSLRAPAQSFGSVALTADGERAVLFTNARASGRVTIVDRTLASRSLDLIAAVRAVFVTPDGSHALALQTPPAGSVKRGAFSVFSLADVRAPKLVASDAPAEAVALAPDGSERALVSVSDASASSYGAYLVRMPNLQVDFSELPSRPLATGMIPAAGKGFVAQAHPEGRITFIDLADGAGREITGFELSSKVVAR